MLKMIEASLILNGAGTMGILSVVAPLGKSGFHIEGIIEHAVIYPN